MNTDALLYEYAVVRYVPRVEREEFVNIGLLMMCKRRRWLQSQFSIDQERLRAFDPDVDIDALRQQICMFSRALPDLPAEERFRWLTAVKSSVLQTSRPHPGLVENDGEPLELLQATFTRLFARLVE